MRTGHRMILRAPRHRPGFTLIEVLTTIVVLVVALPVIVQGFHAASRVAIRARQRATATTMAQTEMEDVIAEQSWYNLPMSGDEKHVGTVYTWNAVTQDWPDGDSQNTDEGALTNVQELDVTVSWIFEGQQQQIVLSSIIYLPANTITSTGTPVGNAGALP